MRFKSLTLFSSDLDKQKSFYIDKLGFKMNEKTGSHLSIQAGWTELRFEKSSTQPFYHYCFLVPRNQLKNALTWIEQKTTVIDIDSKKIIETTTMWNAESFYFLDGNGNISEFITHYDLDNDTDQDFSASIVLGVNEIGCPCKNINSLNDWLTKEIGSSFWTGDKERFGTHGNAEGCFLMVNNEVKNTWFPTDRFPESAPFMILIEQNNRQTHITFESGKFKKT